jgi:hypothetical protein
VTAGSLAALSHWRAATASRVPKCLERRRLASVIEPPCSASIHTDSADSSPKYPGSTAHRYRFTATFDRTGWVTAFAEPEAQPPHARLAMPGIVTATDTARD